jgi:hypothetical protein
MLIFFQRFLMQVQKAVEEGVRVLPPISQDFNSEETSELIKTSLMNASDNLKRQSPSKMGISETAIRSVAICDTDLLVEQFFNSVATPSFGKVSRKTKQR